MAFPVKQVRTLDERLCIIEEVKKTHQRREDVAERLGQPPSTLNRIIAKKKIREHAYVSGPGACDVWCAVCGRKVW
jgi:DNA-binding NtrC family response regulator